MVGVFIVVAATLTTMNAASAASAQSLALAGLNCTKTDKANGGFTLDCDPVGGAPSPSASVSPSSTSMGSPSASPSTSSPSPSPSSTTTPPPTAFPLNCYRPIGSGSTIHEDPSRLDECGYPSTNTTGAKGSTFTAYNGTLTIRTGGTWTNLDITGCLSIETDQPVTIRNVKVHPAGGSGSNCNGNVSHHGSGSVLLEDVTSFCNDGHGHGFWVSNTVANRVQTYGCENGFELNENSVVRNSYIRAMEGSGAHGDGIQSQEGGNVLVEHNTIMAHGTSAIITNPTTNPGWKIRGNFLGGGGYTIYCPETNRTGWEITGNRFIPHHMQNVYGQDGTAYGYADACESPIVWTNNKRDDTGALVSP
jgi:hypothetical protein